MLMAQRIFNSFRRLPSQFTSARKKQDNIEVIGSHYKINVCSNIGFPAKPSSLAYDQALNIFALATRDGMVYVYGKPGVVYLGSHKDAEEIIKVIFIPGSGKLLTLGDADNIYIWEIDSSDAAHPFLNNIGRIENIFSSIESKVLDRSQPPSTEILPDYVNHITAVIVTYSGDSIITGTDQGNVASIRRNLQIKRGVAQAENTMWSLPTLEEIITPLRVLKSLPVEKRSRLRLDAVVILSERPGYPGQLLIGYNMGLCVIFDLLNDRVLALLPSQYELEAAAWCGGSGLPIRGALSKPTSTPPHLGTRLITAYSNGSLGVWQIPLFGTDSRVASALPAQTLNMMESPSMPYGPFPCKSISKLFWLPSHKSGITIFSGGMPRSTYGNRHTVSIFRGSNLDQAAAANLAAALRADSGIEDILHDENEEEFDEGESTGLLPNGLVPGAPAHVFDSDAPEHICLDLPSPVVDVCPVGPAGGPGVALLILCDEELVAVDLLTPGWPLFSLPYLSCLHSSSLTAYGLFTQVNPSFIEQLEKVSSVCEKGDAAGLGRQQDQLQNNLRGQGLSTRPWPIQGGQCVPAVGNTSPDHHVSVDPAHSLVTSNDLLITGHENGTASFWRLGPGGCARKVFTLHTGSLFEGDFGPDVSGDAQGETEEEAGPWPPFRRAGLFDPFIDDVRAAIKSIRLVDNTIVLGGAAGQVSVWQFADTMPRLSTTEVPIAPEIHGFRWKGHNPLTVRPSIRQRCRGVSLYPIGVVLSQPPSPITAIAVCELSTATPSPTSGTNVEISPSSAPGVLVGIGSAHGLALLHFPAPPPPPSSSERSMESPDLDSQSRYCHLLLHRSTIPANTEALAEAAVGEGWTRRRTRELKNSLRDSFRRLKRMKSGRSSITTRNNPNVLSEGQHTPHPPMAPPPISARVGLRKSITKPTFGGRQIPHMSGDPLQEAISHARGATGGATAAAADEMTVPSSGGEREICDRPAETANTALVRCLAFGPPVHTRIRPPAGGTNTLMGSFFAGTSGGSALVYALFSDSLQGPEKVAARHAAEIQLQHRAPIINIRLIDTKTHCPLSPSAIRPLTFATHTTSENSPAPHMMVISEEQVRIFALPAISLRQKARITAKDGYRIKIGNIISFGQSPNSGDVSGGGSLLRGTGAFGPEFSCVFTNNGGQAVVLSVPHLRRRDTIPLMGPGDILEMNSIMFAEPASCTQRVVIGPSLGVYQIAPGQLTMFDVLLASQNNSVLGMAYRTVHRVKPIASAAPTDAESVGLNLVPGSRLHQRLTKPFANPSAFNPSPPIHESPRAYRNAH